MIKYFVKLFIKKWLKSKVVGRDLSRAKPAVEPLRVVADQLSLAMQDGVIDCDECDAIVDSAFDA